MSKSTEERLLREKEFHNETFANNSRSKAKKYYSAANRSKEYYRQRINSDLQGKKVLEYGCGPGSAAFELAEQGAEVFAIDISEVAIDQTLEKAKQENLEIKCSVMDAENLNYESDYFDLICGSGILHHLDLEKACSELNRTLKPEGRAVFFEPLGHNPIINLYRNLTPDMRTEDEHPLLMKDIDLMGTYFNKIDVKHFNLFETAASFIPPLQKPLAKLDDALFSVFPALKKHSWIVVLELSNPE